MTTQTSAVTILLLALFAGCGLAPNGDLTGRRVADGVAPWEDLGSVELCLGNERVGPEGSAIGGFCVDQNTPNEAICGEDSDCRTREMCVCGRCTVRYCTSNGECGKGHTCAFSEKRCLPSCRSDADCPGPGAFCSGGTCKARCGTTADCQYGEVCGNQNRCVVGACGAPGDCRPTEICKVQRIPRATAQPSVIARDEATFVMLVEMADVSGLRRHIFRAISRDGVHFKFDPAVPVVDGGAGDARAPSLVELPAGGYRLYYATAAGVVAAESTDARSFGPPSLVIPGNYRAPGAVVTSTGPLVYVQVGDGSGGIALWTGSGTPIPVMSTAELTDPILWREIARIGSPAARLVVSPSGDTVIQVWFDAFGRESASSIQFGERVDLPANDSIGFASTLLEEPGRLAPFPFNPVFDRINAFLDHREEREPHVVKVPGRNLHHLYYVGFSSGGTVADGIGVARNPPSRGAPPE